MKNFILVTILAFITISCGSGDKGELVGVKGKKYFSEKPFGMTLIPGGAFIMGKSDDDLVGIQDAPTKTVTVRSFYMDETEITNAEYRQFVHWVRDSIIRTNLAEANVKWTTKEEFDADTSSTKAYAYKNAINDELTAYEQYKVEYVSSVNPLNWDTEIIFNRNDYPDKDYAFILEDMFLPDDQVFNDVRTWDVSKIRYNYKESNVNNYLETKQQLIKSLELRKPYTYEGYMQKDYEGLGAYVDLNLENQDEKAIHDEVKEYVDTWNKGLQDDSVERLLYEGRMDKYLKENFDLERKDFVAENSISIYPDTTVWVNDFKYSNNLPMHNDYFSHDAYNDYPVVGVTWQQAKAFCDWRTMKKNSYQKTKNKNLVPKFRLPTEAEWEYAARGGIQGASYPWGGPYTKDDRGTFLANFKPMRGDYAVDCALYTVEADAYEANDYGLFNMSGNVAEWVDSSYESDAYEYSSSMNPNVNNAENNKKITRGGSWKDVKYYLQVSSRDYEYDNVSRSYIGFRTVHDYLGSDIIANDQTKYSRNKK